MGKPIYCATQGKAKDATTTKEALIIILKSLYRTKTVIRKAVNIKIVSKVISIGIKIV